jgi:hypothetical protein
MPARDLNLPIPGVPRIPGTPGDGAAVSTLTQPLTLERPGTGQRTPTATLGRPDADPGDVTGDPGAIEYASWMRLRWPCAA